MSVDQAVQSPRLHIEIEALRMKARFPDSLVSDIIRQCSDCRVFEGHNIFFGGVHVVKMNAKCGFEAFGDPRRGGVGRVA